MLRLAEAGQDFEYRRLLIEENELDLHVAFSKMMVYKWLSWSFLVLAAYNIYHPVLVLAFFGLAILSRFFSFVNNFAARDRHFDAQGFVQDHKIGIAIICDASFLF